MSLAAVTLQEHRFHCPTPNTSQLLTSSVFQHLSPRIHPSVSQSTNRRIGKSTVKYNAMTLKWFFFQSLLLAQAPASWKQQQPSPPLLEKGAKKKKKKWPLSCSLPSAHGRIDYCVLLLPSVGVSLQCRLECSHRTPRWGRVSAFKESSPGFTSATTQGVCFVTAGFRAHREREEVLLSKLFTF